MSSDRPLSDAEELRAAASELPLRDFEAALRRLADPDAHQEPGELRMLSAPNADELARFRSLMPSIEPDQRHRMASTLVEFGEADFQCDFRALMTALLEDEDARVRGLAIDGLWESTDLGLVDRFAAILASDPVDEVRAHAARALGAFVEMAELREHLRPRLAEALALLLERAGDEREHPEVRRRALASAGFAEHPDLIGLIEHALDDDALEVRAGALRAMGNSADDRWAEEVVAWLDEAEPELRFEAVRAAGELSIEAAVGALSSLARYEIDRAIRGEAIWALGEIGGKDARRTLEAVGAELSGVDEDLAAMVEDALSCCALIDGDFSFASLDEPGDDDGSALLDLEDLDGLDELDW